MMIVRKGGFADFLWPKALILAVLLACIAMTKSADAVDALPEVETGTATVTGDSSATLRGTVDINTSTDKDGYVMFFYGDAEGNYTDVSEITTITRDGETHIAIPVEDKFNASSVHYKIVGQNNIGTSYGENESFAITNIIAGNVTLNTVNAPLLNAVPTPAPPVATTGTATFTCEDDGSITATLCGTVTVSGGLKTYYFFAYTEQDDCCLDNITEIMEIPIPGTTTTTAIDYPICITQYGLGTETVYHYALWAQNKAGAKVRNDQSDCGEFKTPPCEGGGETAVELASFTAAAGNSGKAVMRWETASEVDNAGFNIYRSRLRDGEYKKINDVLIPAQGDATAGASYSYEDTPPARGTYHYKLEDVDTNGVTTMHGPEKVRVRSADMDARRSKGQKNK